MLCFLSMRARICGAGTTPNKVRRGLCCTSRLPVRMHYCGTHLVNGKLHLRPCRGSRVTGTGSVGRMTAIPAKHPALPFPQPDAAVLSLNASSLHMLNQLPCSSWAPVAAGRLAADASHPTPHGICPVSICAYSAFLCCSAAAGAAVGWPAGTQGGSTLPARTMVARF